MNIIILTSSMAENDFDLYVKKANIKPNPSNQNFYSRLIKCLSLNNKVYAVSLRPFCKGMFEEKELDSSRGYDGSVTYYYSKVTTSKTYKISKQPQEICQIIDNIVSEEQLDGFIILVDTLRYGLIKAALRYKKHNNVKIVGVVTDNPGNLSNVKSSFVKSVIKSSSEFDGYICLTERLNKIYNKNEAPYYIVEGLVDEFVETKKLPIGDYIFFGGALYERYGVKSLINAFHSIDNPKVNLVLAGSGELEKYIQEMSKKDNRILYLSQVDKQMIYQLEQHALLNVNPRPYDTTLDNESVPSKLIEYIASGAPTISTHHTTLNFYFPGDVIWIEDKEDALKKAIEDHIDPSVRKEDLKRAATASVKVYEKYGLKVQSDSLFNFLEAIRIDSIPLVNMFVDK